MSRTDVHRPPWVQLQDPLNFRYTVVVHHHWEHDEWDEEQRRWLVIRTAPCDLGDPDGRCRRWEKGRYFLCGCWMCNGQFGRRHARRSERTTLRAQLRAAVKTLPGDRGALDIPAPGPPTKW